MAELELTVHCKTLPNKVGFATMCALFPVWALFLPTCLGLVTSLIMQRNVPGLIVLELLSVLAALPVISVMLTAYFEDDRVNLSKDCLSLPLSFLIPMRLRRTRSWQELKEARILRNPAGNSKEDKIYLGFHSGETLQLKAGWFSKSDLEQLLLSVELWGKDCSRTAELVDYQHSLQNEIRGIGKGSYTQMWEEELGRRFNATSFVPLEPGQKLCDGRLTVVRQLAFGGLSAIYLAERENKDVVVLKEAVVPASSDADTRNKAEELFLREAQLLVQLKHPNIARVYDHFPHDGRNYLMLEYVNGQDLRQLVKQNGAQDQRLVLKWAVKIADILNYLHTQSPPVIHRDLTPDNLVLRNDGTVKLIDFGAANEFVGTATGTLVGKQAYIAPEQLRGKADLQSDIYSFGGTLHFLLTSKDPVPLSETHPKRILPEINEELDALVADLTAFEKSNRVPSAADAAARLRAIAQAMDVNVDADHNDPAELIGGKA